MKLLYTDRPDRETARQTLPPLSLLASLSLPLAIWSQPTDRQTNKQTNRQAGRQTDIQTKRERERETIPLPGPASASVFALPFDSAQEQ